MATKCIFSKTILIQKFLLELPVWFSIIEYSENQHRYYASSHGFEHLPIALVGLIEYRTTSKFYFLSINKTHITSTFGLKTVFYNSMWGVG